MGRGSRGSRVGRAAGRPLPVSDAFSDQDVRESTPWLLFRKRCAMHYFMLVHAHVNNGTYKHMDSMIQRDMII